MKRLLKQFFILFFALLQCAAPFAHAHAGGLDTGHSIHTHDIDLHALNADYRHIEQSVYAIVSMPEARLDGDTGMPDVSQPIQVSGKWNLHFFAVFSGRSQPRVPSVVIATGHPPAWPQAPPALSHA